MSKILPSPILSKNVRNYLNDVLMQPQTKYELLKVLDKYNQLLLKEDPC